MTIRRLLETVARTALAELDPGRLVARELETMSLEGSVDVVAIGKAAPRMTEGALGTLGDRADEAIIVGERSVDVPGAVSWIGSHPYPDASSVAAGEAILSTVRRSSGTLLVLVSGGASALVEVPPSGVDIEDLAECQRVLMESGVPIGDLNTVRRHCSLVKNGRLLAAAGAPRVVTLLLSDVAGEPPGAIASGPTIADGTTPGDALAVLTRYRVSDRIPPDVVAHLRSGAPPAGTGPSHQWKVLAGPGDLAAAAGRLLEDHGVPATIVTTTLEGEARVAGPAFARRADGRRAVVATGETTVTVRGSGRGGRNQEGALAAALAIEGRPVTFAAIATDGIDGPTEAAGAVVDGGTTARIRSAGLDPGPLLDDNDSNRALSAAGALVETGPTGTNLGDLWMAASELDRSGSEDLG